VDITVYLPDELGARARADPNVNLSRLLRAALIEHYEREDTMTETLTDAKLQIIEVENDEGRTALVQRRAPHVMGVLLAALAFAAAACSAVTTPSGLPSNLPSSLPSVATNSTGRACLDTSTMAIITQLQAPGADVASILHQNKAALVSGLQSFQPADATTGQWRDAFVTALQSSDMMAAEAKVKEITTAGITLAAC
jgi:hypothetical protein